MHTLYTNALHTNIRFIFCVYKARCVVYYVCVCVCLFFPSLQYSSKFCKFCNMLDFTFMMLTVRLFSYNRLFCCYLCAQTLFHSLSLTLTLITLCLFTFLRAIPNHMLYLYTLLFFRIHFLRLNDAWKRNHTYTVCDMRPKYGSHEITIVVVTSTARNSRISTPQTHCKIAIIRSIYFVRSQRLATL